MSFLDYIVTERFIHDDLLQELEDTLATTLLDGWKANGRVEPFLLSWPTEHVTCDDGTTVTHVFYANLPEETETWPQWLEAAVKKTKPYALMLGEQREDEVIVTFESPHGSRCWRFPIERHGDVQILGRPSTRDDVDSIGILWKANRGQA